MALLVASQSTGPSWDETIVPALRKRLESESWTLSKRLSAISSSVHSGDEAPTLRIPSTMSPSSRNRAASPPQPSKSTAIPRPSLQYSRASSDVRPEPNGSAHANGVSSTQPRNRTYSQPKAFDPSSSRSGNGIPTGGSHLNGSSVPLPTPESSRSTSPQYVGRAIDPKPTRIPKVARLGRTSSSSSRRNHQLSGINTVADGKHGHAPYSPLTSENDMWKADDGVYAHQPRSAHAAGGLQHSRLLQEPPPFSGSRASSVDYSVDHSQDDTMVVGRRSNDSEERPFEHWYRGEVSRNGGVGELRVGKRMEMLEIANYGHTFRKASPRTRAFPQPDDTTRRRIRGDSFSHPEDCSSLYLDEDRAAEVAQVLDEGPPTDLDPDDFSDYYSTSIQQGQQQYHLAVPPSPVAVVYESGGGEGSDVILNNALPPPSIQPSRIPTPAPIRQQSEPPRTRTPTLTQRGGSEPPSLPSSSAPQQPTTPSAPKSTSQPQVQAQTQKRRGKSPGASMPASKRSKATAKSIASKKAAEERNRLSIAQYPAPAEGVDMVDAIPSWTEPILASGNWDEVVLPVVARKKGLDGHYERVGGGFPLRKVNKSVAPEPAPGTFGYDYSKYRPPAAEEIPMDEFGRNMEAVVEDDEIQQQRMEERPQANGIPEVVRPTTATTSPKVGLEQNEDNGRMPEDEAGCCKCIIM